MSTRRFVRTILDGVLFLLTIILVVYGLRKGFNLIELSINVIYFSALICKMIFDWIENITDEVMR